MTCRGYIVLWSLNDPGASTAEELFSAGVGDQVFSCVQPPILAPAPGDGTSHPDEHQRKIRVK